MKDWQIKMADIIAELSQNLVRKHGTKNRGILVLADFEGGVGYSVFVGRKSYVDYIFVNEDEIKNVDLLDEFRFIAPFEKRPLGIEIFIKDGQVSSKMTYPEEVYEDEILFEDREPYVISYFGDYPIKYPPMPGGAWEFPPSR